jgi:hypothetical protein
VPHLLRHGTSVFKVISERPVILPSECCALGEGAITTYFKRNLSHSSGSRVYACKEKFDIMYVFGIFFSADYWYASSIRISFPFIEQHRGVSYT